MILRLREETTIGDEQFGFMPGRGTTDAIFAVRQLMEKHREKQKGLHMVFIDLEKAYAIVPRQEVWIRECLRCKDITGYTKVREPEQCRINGQDPSGRRATRISKLIFHKQPWCSRNVNT